MKKLGLLLLLLFLTSCRFDAEEANVYVYRGVACRTMLAAPGGVQLSGCKKVPGVVAYISNVVVKEAEPHVFQIVDMPSVEERPAPSGGSDDIQ